MFSTKEELADHLGVDPGRIQKASMAAKMCCVTPTTIYSWAQSGPIEEYELEDHKVFLLDTDELLSPDDVSVKELKAELAGAEAHIEKLEDQIDKMGVTESSAKAFDGMELPEPWDSVTELVDDLRHIARQRDRYQREAHDLGKQVSTLKVERDQWRDEATEYGLRVKNLVATNEELKKLITEQMNLIDELRDRVEGTAGAAEYLEGSGKKSSLPVRAGLAAVRLIAQRFIRS